MGTNKCASQSGMTAYGTRRHLYDPKNHILPPMDHSTISLQMGTNKCASQVGPPALPPPAPWACLAPCLPPADVPLCICPYLAVRPRGSHCGLCASLSLGGLPRGPSISDMFTSCDSHLSCHVADLGTPGCLGALGPTRGAPRRAGGAGPRRRWFPGRCAPHGGREARASEQGWPGPAEPVPRARTGADGGDSASTAPSLRSPEALSSLPRWA